MTMQIRSSKRRNARSNHVHFNDEVAIFEVPHRKSFTPEDISMLWYQTLDYERIDNDNDNIIDAMILAEHQKIRRLNFYCIRGLDALLPERALFLQETREALWDAVINEQFHQWQIEIDNSEAIAEVSRNVSVHPFERIARLRGLMDEKEAFRIHTATGNDEMIETKKKEKKRGEKMQKPSRNKQKKRGRNLDVNVHSRTHRGPALPLSPTPRQRGSLKKLPMEEIRMLRFSSKSTKRVATNSRRRRSGKV